MQDHRHGTTEIFQCLHLCTESALLKYFTGYVCVLKQHHWNISVATCVYWNSTTEIFHFVRACTESEPLKYFSGYVRVLKVHHRNISEATCLYWNSTTEIFQWLRACTETATPKYFWGCVRVLKLQYWNIQCLPVCTEIALHYWNFSVCTRVYCNCTTQIFQCEPVSTEIFQCLQLSTKLAVLKYFSVNPESITLNCVLNFSGGTSCSQNIASSIYTDCIT